MTQPPAGYSGTPLAKKLGITPGTLVVALDAPANYARLVSPLPTGARIARRLPRAPAFVHVFADRRSVLDSRLRRLRATIVDDGTVWVSWPKRASKASTDITEDVVREIGLPLGFVDVKVCAVDETWSGLKLVIRKAYRVVPR